MFLREPDGTSRSCAYISGPFAGAINGKIVFSGTYLPIENKRSIDFIDPTLKQDHPEIANNLASCAPVCYGITKGDGQPKKDDVLALEKWSARQKLVCQDPSQELTYQLFNDKIAVATCQVLHGSYFFIHDENLVSYGAYNKGEQIGDWTHTDRKKTVLKVEHFSPLPKGWPEYTPESR